MMTIIVENCKKKNSIMSQYSPQNLYYYYFSNILSGYLQINLSTHHSFSDL